MPLVDAEPEVARVKVSYTDELDNGSEQSVSDVAKIRYTDDQAVADRSMNSAVAAEKTLVLTAEPRTRPSPRRTRAITNRRPRPWLCKSRPDAAYADAPAAVRVQIRAETSNLEDFNGQLSGGQYNAASRKVLQSQSYNTRNSK